MAYDILIYDNRSASSTYNAFDARPAGYAKETFRSVVFDIFNDFLDGDLEVVRTLLSTFPRLFPCPLSYSPLFSEAVNDMNPSLKLGDDGIDAILSALESIRGRALSRRQKD